MNAPSTVAVAGLMPCCEGEDWKPLPGWPYEASTCGRGRSIDRLGDDGIWRLGAIVPPQPDKRPGKGYLYWDLRDGRRRRRVPVAVAVLEAHDKPRPGPGYEACHNDGIRTDNHLARLRWDTRAANLADMARHALARAVTDRAAEPSQKTGHCHKLQVRRGAARFRPLSQLSVTSDNPQGTGSPRSIPPFSSHFTPVQSLLQALRSLRRPA